MYKIIGGDQKEYGPVSAEEARRWITERRLQAGSLVQAQGTTDWKPLSLFPEFSAALAALTPARFPPTSGTLLPEQHTNSMATAGLCLSCFALICCGCAPAALLGVIFSIIGLNQANRDPLQTGKALAISGLVIGVIALLGNIVTFSLGLFGGLIEALQR